MLYTGPQRSSASFFVISQSSSLYCHPSWVQDQVSVTFISSHMHSGTHMYTNAHLHKSKQRVFCIKQYSRWNISLKETSVKNLVKTCTPQFILPNRIFFFSLENTCTQFASQFSLRIIMDGDFFFICVTKGVHLEQLSQINATISPKDKFSSLIS